jgi:hypothetical protein
MLTTADGQASATAPPSNRVRQCKRIAQQAAAGAASEVNRPSPHAGCAHHGGWSFQPRLPTLWDRLSRSDRLVEYGTDLPSGGLVGWPPCKNFPPRVDFEPRYNPEKLGAANGPVQQIEIETVGAETARLPQARAMPSPVT